MEEPSRKALALLPLRLHDVVLVPGGEVWARSVWVLWEDLPMGALFFGLDAGVERVLFLRHPYDGELLLAEAMADPGSMAFTGAGEPPSTVEVGVHLYSRLWRRRVRIVPSSDAKAPLRSEVLLVAYARGPDRLLVLHWDDEVWCYRGEVLGTMAYQILPGEKTGVQRSHSD